MVARVKTWTTSETLASSDLNTEFNNIVNAISSSTADHIDLADVYAWTGAHSWSAATTHTNTLTVGVDDAGHDVKFFGNAAGAFSLWDASADTHIIRGATAAGPGKLNLSTGELTVVDGDILGRIDFQAPLEASGTDAILVGASIWAEADDTFGTALNDTDLVFAVAESETAAERMRLSYDGTTVGLTFPGVTTISTAAGALNLTPAAGSAIVLDGTINVDAGVVTGATSITSTAFVGDITGDVTGNADTFTATANNSTNETVYPVFVDGATGTQGAETDTGLTYNPSTGLLSTAAVTTTGVVTAAGFTIGSAVIVEAELETIDGVTAGTVAASKAVVVDSNKDAASFRNITLTGELDAGSLDVSGDADIDGTLEADAITIGSTAIGSIYGVVAGSSSIVTTGALNSGSITSGFGTIDTGSAITTTGVVTAATCEATGDTSAGDNAAMGYTSAEGLILTGQGSTNDVTIKNDADGNIMVCKTGGTVVDFPGKVGIGTAHTDGTLHVHTATAGGVTAGGNYDDLVIENSTHCAISIFAPDDSQSALNFGSETAANGAYITWVHDTNLMTIGTTNSGGIVKFISGDATEAMRIDSSGQVLINDTANGDMTIGLTINQGANDDHILALKSDTAHAATGLAEADTYAYFGKRSADGGGLSIFGFDDTSATTGVAIELSGVAKTPITTHTSGTYGVVQFVAAKASGDSYAAVTGEDAGWTFRTAGATRLLVQGEGEMHITNTTLVALDDEDDIGLLRIAQRGSAQDVGIAMSRWDEEIQSNKSDLIRLGIQSDEEPGLALYSVQKMNSLLGGAIWQVHCRQQDLKEVVACQQDEMETLKIALLEATETIKRLEMN